MTTQDGILDPPAIAGTTTVHARRIGIIGDDHNSHDDGSDLPAEVLVAFAGVDIIIHLGHMGYKSLLARGVLNRLATVAPVLAVQDYSTDEGGTSFVTPADAPRVAGLSRVINADGVRIGAIHNLAKAPGPAIATPPGGLPELTGVPVAETLVEKFGEAVDVVAFAGSHRAVAVLAQGVLFCNPGSPAYPKGPGRASGRSLGTVGVLDVTAGVAAFEIIELSLLS